MLLDIFEWLVNLCSCIPNRGVKIVIYCGFCNTVRDYSLKGNPHLNFKSYRKRGSHSTAPKGALLFVYGETHPHVYFRMDSIDRPVFVYFPVIWFIPRAVIFFPLWICALSSCVPTVVLLFRNGAISAAIRYLY